MPNYAAYRDNIRSGDLLSWTHRAWDSWYDVQVQAVRLATQSEYSHVGVAWVSGGRVWVLESVTPLPRIVPLSNLLHEGCWVTHMGCEWLPETERFALSMIGNDRYEYSKIEAIKAYFGREDMSSDDMQCAKFSKLIYAKEGIVLPGRATPSGVTLAAQERRGPTVRLVPED